MHSHSPPGKFLSMPAHEKWYELAVHGDKGCLLVNTHLILENRLFLLDDPCSITEALSILQYWQVKEEVTR